MWLMNVMLERLNGLLAPCVEAMGYELADLELRREHTGQVLRLFIDQEAGVDLEDCERVSGQVSALLDVEDPIQGHYSLEVSSPGLDRKLAKPEHFDRFAGRQVRIRLHNELDGRRSFSGTLRGRQGASVALHCNGGGDMQFQLDDIKVARLMPQFGFKG